MQSALGLDGFTIATDLVQTWGSNPSSANSASGFSHLWDRSNGLGLASGSHSGLGRQDSSAWQDPQASPRGHV